MVRLLLRFAVLGFALGVAIVPVGCTDGSSVVPTDGGEDAPGFPLKNTPGSGSARISGRVRSADSDDSVPLGGVRLALGDAVSFSNADGSFDLLAVPAGSQPFFVDAGDLTTGDGKYGQFKTTLDVGAGTDDALDEPLYIPFIPNESARQVLLDADTKVGDADGVAFSIPPGGARQDGLEYEGTISVHLLPIDRAPMPIPERLSDRTAFVVSIQPAGLTFPVGLPITLPVAMLSTSATDSDQTDAPTIDVNGVIDDENVSLKTPSVDTADVRFVSIWSLDTATGTYVNVGVGERVGDGFVTVAGGLRESGILLITPLEVDVVGPCSAAEADGGLACFDGWLTAIDVAGSVNTATLPGARTVLGRIDAVMTALASLGEGSAQEAEELLGVSFDLYPIARDAIAAYRDLFRRAENLGALEFAIEGARAVCVGVAACGEVPNPADVDDALDVAIGAVGSFSSRFDRLFAAADALTPFYAPNVSVELVALPQLTESAREFRDAYDDFAPFASPVDAYDVLVDSLRELERGVRSAARGFSAPVGAVDDSSDGLLTTICDGLGATQLTVVENGRARVELDGGGSSCAIIVMDRSRGLTSVPISTADFLLHLRPPLLIGLNRMINVESVALDVPASGFLSADAPVAIHPFSVAERRSATLAFSAEGGAATVGLATGDGVVRLAGETGMMLANVPDGDGLAVYVFAEALEDGETIPYTFSIEADESLFDFGKPVAGSFDVNNRAAGILFEANEGDDVLIEKRCCDPGYALYSYLLLAPDGSTVPRFDFHNPDPGTGNEAFHITTDGLYRIIATPFPGEFADYEFVVHKLIPVKAEPIVTGELTTGVIDEPGETIRYAFEALAGDMITVEGVSSVGLDPVRVSITGPDGEPIISDDLLYFDGSSFAALSFDVVADGEYEVAFRAVLGADPLTGTITFRLLGSGVSEEGVDNGVGQDDDSVVGQDAAESEQG